MADAAAQLLLRTSDLFDGIDYLLDEFVQIQWTGVRQAPFGERPNSFIGIQFGGISGKVFQMQTALLVGQLAQKLAPMHGRIIQQDDDRTAKMTEQHAEEASHIVLSDAVQEELIVKAQSAFLGTHGNGRDDGKFFPPALPIAVQGSAADGSPGLHHQRHHQEARFIRKNYMGAQPPGLFFIRGQSFCFHPAMASSSRSIARRSGFWWLHFRLCIKRPI